MTSDGGTARRGIRIGTPVPASNREQESRGSGPVITYQAPPEMLARYRAMPGPGKKKASSKTLAEQNLSTTTREEADMAATLTKEQYLEKRKSGMSRSQIAKEMGFRNSGGLYAYLQRWGIKDPVVEEREMTGLPVVDEAVNDSHKTVSESVETVPEMPETVSGPSEADLLDLYRVDDSASVTDGPLNRLTVTVQLDPLTVTTAVLNALIADAYTTATAHGWHEQTIPIPMAVALMHSELSEALQADRKNEGNTAVAEELADVVIRIFDTCAEHRLALVPALLGKMAKNRTREYRHGGRKY